ncbi:MAG TPA: hypothetical protein VMM17_01750 [Gemmatimonadaceae bacterium]|nr:hypothetical protein [Gemmatimonadaceae bacterium]
MTGRSPLLRALPALVIFASPAGAQVWNDPQALALVERASDRRAVQLADTALKDYRARAHGYLTFLAQVGAGFPEPPKIVKADEIALDVYWAAPALSKQVIVGARDTLLLPTDIQYHRDHLGIIQNNFPEIIRLGDGDEVRDVPHPISGAGLLMYDFAVSDSLQLRLGPRTIDVIEVRVRPKDDRAPRVVGAVYIERESADLVRMALGFTRSALKDESLEDLSVVLENGLIEGQFWLPRRQEIEIRRTGTWLDYPVRTIIRGRWEICCHAVNLGLNRGMFAGPEIVAAPRRQVMEGDEPLFTGTVLEGVADEADPVSDAEVRRVQAEVRQLVRAQALARPRRPMLAGTRVSDLVRFNRVEGLALGVGVGQPLGMGFAALGQARYGFADDRWKGRGELAYRRAGGFSIHAAWRDSHAEAGDTEEVSLTRNTLAAQEFGSDYTEPFGVRGPSLELFVPLGRFGRLATLIADERHSALAVNATPVHGRFAPTLPVADGRVRTAAARIERSALRLGESSVLRYSVGFSGIRSAPDSGSLQRYGRVTGSFRSERAFGDDRLVVDLFAAAVGGGPAAAPQHHVLLGGPVSGPGYDYHELAGRRGGFARVEWRIVAPFPSISLGRFGRTPPTAVLAPYAHVAFVGAPPAFRAPRNGAYPAVGVAVMPFFELLRIDVARGLRDGRWTFGVDVTRDFWPVL